jgi:hypothetical protein
MSKRQASRKEKEAIWASEGGKTRNRSKEADGLLRGVKKGTRTLSGTKDIVCCIESMSSIRSGDV